ncbi:uncharacterized protein RCC_09135 [Ramularia collo-cygni]|uniref:Uncharacterized protein n=1 Tax=Ramularia collo-cygni TaxID=112498 RepID=A0A2D3VGW6_9PEZI|nr:uncharacterized protein RCC_09135 [Ramularia collo-cygni]CZT23421.1 uncharacterized protein RCC_09135 [Ramularia collo-cygni]
MPGFPSSEQFSLSFRPKGANQLNGTTPQSNTFAHSNSDARPTSEQHVDHEQVFQDVSWLAARPSDQRTLTDEMDLKEARRLICVELANAAARGYTRRGARISKCRRKEKLGRGSRPRNERSDGDGLDDLNRLLSTVTYDPHPNEGFDGDGLDDLNRPITTTEQSVDGIAGEMDIEWGGMRDAIATENEWTNASDAERAALEKAIRAARSHGDWFSRFDPQAVEQLAQIQQDLLQNDAKYSPSSQVQATLDPSQQEQGMSAFGGSDEIAGAGNAMEID